VGRDGGVVGVIWGNQEAEYFRAEDSTEIKRDLPVGQHKGLGVRTSSASALAADVTGITAADNRPSQIRGVPRMKPKL
jgi:hypothetical protein